MDAPLALVVEDSPTQAKLIAACLARHGLRTITADDGLDGLRAVDEHQPDLVVLDMHLPTMNGHQVCRRLKRDPQTRHIPVILLTLGKDLDAAEQGIKAGADRYMTKEMFTTESLAQALDDLGIGEG